ncbi:MAG: hypothetical protein SV760_08135, partial [Halobacteria archaeon]|nr:hypothetical protein [Halobacteria archaeon]
TVSNYTGSKKEIELHSFVTDEPALRDGEADVVEMDGEYDVVWNLEIGDGETRDLVFSSESRPELTVKNLDEELLEVEE